MSDNASPCRYHVAAISIYRVYSFSWKLLARSEFPKSFVRPQCDQRLREHHASLPRLWDEDDVDDDDDDRGIAVA